MAVQLRQTIDEELEYKVDSVTFWTDSISVLKCIKNENKRFHTFESIRLTVIRNGSSVSEWRYVQQHARNVESPGWRFVQDEEPIF